MIARNAVMSVRRFGRWILLPLCLCVATLDLHVPSLIRADGSASAMQQRDLKEVLEYGLRARRPEETAFINRVVGMVQTGDLPLELVMSTFHWARKKRPYPMPYFMRALRIRAADQGIAL
jgi:hypothetical protein